MSDTPRTLQEQCYGTCWAACDRIEQLERELTAAQSEALKLQEENARLQERIARLEEGGDKAVRNSYFPDRLAVWNEAKDTQ